MKSLGSPHNSTTPARKINAIYLHLEGKVAQAMGAGRVYDADFDFDADLVTVDTSGWVRFYRNDRDHGFKEASDRNKSRRIQMENPLNEKDKKFLRFIIAQHKQRFLFSFVAGVFFCIGIFLSISGILMDDPELFRPAGMMFTLSIMFFLFFRRERKVINIVKKIIEDKDLE